MMKNVARLTSQECVDVLNRYVAGKNGSPELRKQAEDAVMYLSRLAEQQKRSRLLFVSRGGRLSVLARRAN